MKPDERFAALCKIRDAHAYTVVDLARLAIKHNEITDGLRRTLSESDLAHKAAVSYENSKEYKTFPAAHRGVPLQSE